MFARKIFAGLLLTGLLLTGMTAMFATAAFAQGAQEKGSGWASRAAGARATPDREASDFDAAAGTARIREDALPASGFLDAIEREKEARRKALVGTWRVSIPASAGGAPAFNAYQTFHQGGTFTEFSDLLPTLTESPAAGAWDLDGDRYLLTFELFIFDDKQAPVGMIRVRCSIRLVNADEIAAEAIVDLIEPDGKVTLDIDRTPFTGRRVKPLAAR
ncbi:MAG: hypothetical protein SF339_25770 [Blastocatellia bacterium]|nr:hypothetical protein [Blastocatellia bacterium]